MFDYIEYCLPIRGSLPQGAARQLVEQEGLGIVRDDGDVDGLTDALSSFYDDSELRSACRRRAAALRGSFSSAAQGAAWRRAVAEIAEVAESV